MSYWGNAFFTTYFFITEIQSKGVDILIEQHGSLNRVTDFRRGQKLVERDQLIVLNEPKRRPDWMSEAQYHAAPDSLAMRELKTGGKSMITTLCHKRYPKETLETLCKSRWHIELDIRNIKDAMGMNVLSCKTPEMAIKKSACILWSTI